ncbi:MAG: hypothetical protein AAF762_14505 [Pseudomonadota bacterium]
MRLLLSLIPLGFATLANAGCPTAPDIALAEGRILESIQAAPSEMAARPLSQELWALWAKAPNSIAQEMLDAGMQARSYGDYRLALSKFDDLVDYCPDYAEGYNQRAFVNYLSGRYELALNDLDLAIARSPRHVAAIAGKALTLIGLGRDAEAQLILREALALNPWLSERHLLTEPPGEEL